MCKTTVSTQGFLLPKLYLFLPPVSYQALYQKNLKNQTSELYLTTQNISSSKE